MMQVLVEPEETKKSADWLDSWHVSATLNREYDSIDGLRGIAILMVVACHLLYVNPAASKQTQLIMGVFGAGTFGVPIFFVLSGFLISYPFWTRKFRGSADVVPLGYAARRFWKIYPPLALSVLLFTPIYVLRGDSSFWGLAAQWLAGWPLLQPVSGQLNPAMWSLVVEVHFYILLPIIFLLFRRVDYRRCLWALPLVFLIIPMAIRWRNHANGVHFTLHPEINTRFPSMLDSFAFGLWLAGLEAGGFLRRSAARLVPAGFILLGLALVICSWVQYRKGPNLVWELEALNWMVRIAAAFLLCSIASTGGIWTQILANPVLRWCGLISYEWYLFHQPIALWAREIFGPASGDRIKYVATVGGSFVVGLAIAAAVYRWFSLPILRHGRARAGSGKN